MSAESFEHLIRWLHGCGYRSETVSGGCWSQPTSAATVRAVVLTFDDGYACHWETVRPILLRYGMTGTFFIPTAFISDHPERKSPTVCGDPEHVRFMTWDQVSELKNQGFEIGSHGCRHLAIGSLQQREAQREIEDSKRHLEARMGSPIDIFAYPYGQRGAFSAASRDMLRAAGYKVACTQLGWAPNPATDPFLVPRTNIEALDSLRHFRMKLDGAYDMLHRLRRGRL